MRKISAAANPIIQCGVLNGARSFKRPRPKVHNKNERRVRAENALKSGHVRTSRLYIHVFEKIPSCSEVKRKPKRLYNSDLQSRTRKPHIHRCQYARPPGVDDTLKKIRYT
jgi:hypothetical protein